MVKLFMRPSNAPTAPRVVVVEDDPIVLNLLKELLTGEGYEVFPHSRASDAHVLVQNVQPRVVILDLRLTGDSDEVESGWRVLDRLVLDPTTRHIPVVVASGAVESIEAHRPALLPDHGVSVLLKPYDVDQLLELLAGALGPPPDDRREPDRLLRAAPLTPRQREIARLIAYGYTNAQIAARLVLECGTVANHVAHILGRLGVANRAQVAAWATAQGLVENRRFPEQVHVA